MRRTFAWSSPWAFSCDLWQIVWRTFERIGPLGKMEGLEAKKVRVATSLTAKPHAMMWLCARAIGYRKWSKGWQASLAHHGGLPVEVALEKGKKRPRC